MRFLVGRRVEIVSYVVVALLTSLVVVYAVRADGYSRHRADLNDGGIWVTKDDVGGGFGRLNKPIGELDGLAPVPGGVRQKIDVQQDGAAVVGWSTSGHQVYGIDVTQAQASPGAVATVPAVADVTVFGGSLGVVDQTTGKVWATVADPTTGVPSIADVDAGGKPLATVGGGAGGTVTADGTVVVASADEDALVTLAPVSDGFAAPVRTDLELSGTPALTAIGTTVVVLDVGSGHLTWGAGMSADVPPDAVLQQPTATGDSVLVATATTLIEVDLATGRQTEIGQGSGSPAARPVRLGDCAYGAWSGSTSSVVTVCADQVPHPASLKGGTTDLVLRTNRGEVVLNDRLSGNVWDIDQLEPQRVDNWQDFAPKNKDDSDDSKSTDDDESADEPPKALADALGARPGATTVLHVLDNDQAPSGHLLAIQSVSSPADPDVSVRVSPDAQALLLSLPGDATDTVGVTYVVNAGSDKTASAPVTVTVRGADSHQAPELREKFDVADRTFTVPARGSITVPVIGDWRDPGEGDAVSLTDATASKGIASVNAAGQIRFDAPGGGGQVDLSYTVTDSDGVSNTSTVPVTVQRPTDTTAVSAQAEPDLARGIVGEPVVVQPLGNDIPGSDPFHLDSELELGAPVAGAPGLTVQTDLTTGKVTVTASRPGPYLLTYQAAFGSAANSRGQIRIDIDRPAEEAQPITVPDALTLFGTSQGIVDVLANDYDPLGRLLVVQSAVVRGAAQPVEVSVIDGHWLRLRATAPITGDSLTVRYTVSNGVQRGVPGDLVVRQAPALAKDEPVTTDDHALVRVGGGVVVPVLDNDFAPSGEPLVLRDPDPTDGVGVLSITPDVGRAFVSGRMVRYLAPDTLPESQTVRIAYGAATSSSNVVGGVLTVTLTAPASDDNPNQPPTPPTVEARVVAGDTVKIKVPTSGADPDGDAVSVSGIGSAPELGAITGFGATQLVYRSFPSASGTDVFTYQVVDTLGAVATGTVRVAVVDPAEMPPPTAVDDTIIAAPGRRVSVQVMANDYVGVGDVVKILDLADANEALAEGTRLTGPQGPIEITAGPDDGHPVKVSYQLSNGVAPPTLATVTVRSRAGYNNPPVVFDAYGRLGDGPADTVTVDVLARAYDPDGAGADIRVDKVFGGAHPKVSSDGASITVDVLPTPQVLTYRAVDADGGSASAFLFVPAGAGAPYLVPGHDPLVVDQGGKARVDLDDWVVDPAGKPVRLGVNRTLTASPSDVLRVSGTPDLHALELTVTDPDYVGPASVTFQVTDGATLDDPDGIKAFLTIPVQIGVSQPIIRCPDTPLTLVEGGVAIEPDVAALCHVWTSDPDELGSLVFDGEARDGLSGVEVGGGTGSTLTLRAPAGAVPTRAPGQVRVTVEGYDAVGTLNVVVVKAGPPSATPLAIQGVLGGESRTIDLGPQLYSPFADAQKTVVSIEKVSGDPADASPAGGSKVTLRPGQDSHGTIVWRVVLSDVADRTRADRQATVTITMEVLNRPDTPGRPVVTDEGDAQVTLKLDVPADNGADITEYQVSGGPSTTTCRTETCIVTGLDNGRRYSFSATACNVVGCSEASGTVDATPDRVPGAVRALTWTDRDNPQDGHVQLSWQAPKEDSSISSYVLTWDDGGQKKVGATTYAAPIGGLDNNHAYTVSITAVGKRGPGPSVEKVVQSSGRPAAPRNVAVGHAETADGQAAVTVTWAFDDTVGWEGRVGTYEVFRDGRSLGTTTQKMFEQNVPYDGSTYVYSVRAVNATGGAAHASPTAKAAPYEVSGTPDRATFSAASATGVDKQGQFSFEAGALRGSGGTWHLSTASGDYQGPINGGGRVVDEKREAGANGIPVTPTAWICNAQGYCSEPVPGPSLVPFGPIGAVTISQLDTQLGPEISYHVHIEPNGKAVSFSVNGHSGATGVGTYDIDFRDNIGFNSSRTLRVDVTDNDTRSKSSSPVGARTEAEPAVQIRKGAAGQTSYCNTSPCRQILVSAQRLLPNTDYRIWYDTDCNAATQAQRDACLGGSNSGAEHYQSELIRTNGNGDFSDQGTRYFGYPQAQVWVDLDAFGNKYVSNHVTW